MSRGHGWVLFLLVAYDKRGPGLSRGWVGLELNIFRFLMKCRRWGKPIRALSRAWFSAGAVLAGVRESAVLRRLVLPSQVKETLGWLKGSWTRRPEAPVP